MAPDPMVSSSHFGRFSGLRPGTIDGGSGVRTWAAVLGLAGVTTSAIAADLPVGVSPPPWSWQGLYVGAHTGALIPGETRFSNSFGSPIFGDKVRTPGWLFGGQIGYNWQAAQSPWVFGVEADISGADADGTNTCFAASGDVINATCRVRPEVTGTVTGRIGYAAGPQGRTLLYLKGGLAWAHSRFDMVTNNAGDVPGGNTADMPPIEAGSARKTVLGGTVGAGLEYAMTPAWSLRLEYDYLTFASTNVTNFGLLAFDETGTRQSATPPGSSGVRQDLHQFKVGVNYRWGADPWATWADSAGVPGRAISKAPALPGWAPGWELELGARYVASWTRFQDDLGRTMGGGAPEISAVSRLTYESKDVSGGEIFGRIDTPWNFFVKGFAGRSKISDGHQNDEDFGISFPDRSGGGGAYYVPYTNTRSPKVDGNVRYAVADVGYNVWRGPTYKAGAFVGYSHFEQHMFAHGCFQLANPNATNCNPPVPATAPGGITQDTKWQGLRVGLGGEFMPHERIKIGAEVAYLPYVKFNGLDQHLFLGLGSLASSNPDTGEGRGVQLEGSISYMITRNFSVGVGGRYWAMWTNTSGEARRTLQCDGVSTCTPLNDPPAFMKGASEQASVFVQASLKFDSAPAAVRD